MAEDKCDVTFFEILVKAWPERLAYCEWKRFGAVRLLEDLGLAWRALKTWRRTTRIEPDGNGQ
jgi:hypothetical protein